jgi:hypothetical protein
MSNAQSWGKVFAPIDAANKDAVLQNTWGHLAPQKNTTYRGKLLFCKSEYNSGSITLISSKMVIDSSPWFYDSVYEFLYSFDELEYGHVYQINATWRNYKWWGKPVKVFSL